MCLGVLHSLLMEYLYSNTLCMSLVKDALRYGIPLKYKSLWKDHMLVLPTKSVPGIELEREMHQDMVNYAKCIHCSTKVQFDAHQVSIMHK